MRRFVIIVAVLGAGALASAATVAGASTPRAKLRGFVCQRALEPPRRVATITAVMRPLSGTQKMQLRFELLDHPKGSVGTYGEVPGGDLGKWVSPQDPSLGQRPGDVWILNHPVFNLAAPVYYRFRVTFRWLGQHGKLLGTAVRWSAVCYEPELRPDLYVGLGDGPADLAPRTRTHTRRDDRRWGRDGAPGHSR